MPTSQHDAVWLRRLGWLTLAGCALILLGALLDRYTGPAGDAPAGLATH